LFLRLLRPYFAFGAAGSRYGGGKLNRFEIAVLGISLAVTFAIALVATGDISTALAHTRGR